MVPVPGPSSLVTLSFEPRRLCVLFASRRVADQHDFGKANIDLHRARDTR